MVQVVSRLVVMDRAPVKQFLILDFGFLIWDAVGARGERY